MLMVYRSYLKELFVRFRNALGGGSLLLIAVGIIEHYTLESVSWSIFLWVAVGSCVIALMHHGAEQHKRLMPAMIIRGPRYHDWKESGLAGRGYYFDIFNPSRTVVLKGVRVDLEKIVPDVVQGMIIPMKVKHDSYDTREFAINPGATRQIDFITGPCGPGSQKALILTHTIPQGSEIPRDTYLMTFCISAENVPAQKATFKVFVSQNEELKSVQL